jgi:hypothetical protein
VATLKSTGFQEAVDYKVIECTAISATGTQSNVANGAGTLHAVIVNSTNSSDPVSVHILDGEESVNSQVVFKGVASGIKTLQIPTGFTFDELNFWVSKYSGEDDTTSFAGNVDVSLVCS